MCKSGIIVTYLDTPPVSLFPLSNKIIFVILHILQHYCNFSLIAEQFLLTKANSEWLNPPLKPIGCEAHKILQLKKLFKLASMALTRPILFQFSMLFPLNIYLWDENDLQICIASQEDKTIKIKEFIVNELR